jgi:predicted P-loop ATPase
MAADLRVVAGDETPEQAAAERAVRPSWLNKLSRRRGGGALLRISRNAELVLIHDDRWQGVIAWDDFRQSIVFRKEPPWDPDVAPAKAHDEWTDSDITRLQGWLSQHHGLHLGAQVTGGALLVAAERTSSHEVRDYLSALKWDGEPRVPQWASRYLGADPGPYGELVSRCYLTSAVARIMQPGCKVDSMIVLEGPQGARKSTALATLFGAEWFSDTPLDLESKDRFVALRGVWGIELAELDSLRKAEVARIKSFLSSREDKFRPPYGRGDVKVPRQCVFAGTTNPDVYLRDDTGNRRFWPVRCGQIDIPALRADRDQLWAEAVALYHAHTDGQHEARWWPEGDELTLCREQQDERMLPDPWEELLADWLSGQLVREWVTTEQALEHLGIEPSKRTRADQGRIGTILQKLGWTRGRPRIGGRKRYVYYPPGPTSEGEGGQVGPGVGPG